MVWRVIIVVVVEMGTALKRGGLGKEACLGLVKSSPLLIGHAGFLVLLLLIRIHYRRIESWRKLLDL